LILLLGALQDSRAIPSLSRILKNYNEPIEFREKAIKSLIYIRNSSRVPYHWPGVTTPMIEFLRNPSIETLSTKNIMTSYFLSENLSAGFQRFPDQEIEALIPKSSRYSRYISDIHPKLETKNYSIGLEALNYVLSNKRDDILLRKHALTALNYFIHGKLNIEVIEDVLIYEWEDFAYEAIEILVEIPDEKVISILYKFAQNNKIDKARRLKAIIGLAKIGKPASLSALKKISKTDPNDVLCKASTIAADKFNEREEFKLGFPTGIVAQGRLGINISEITPDIKKTLGLNNEIGALVIYVSSGESAEKAGIQENDVIVEFDGIEIKVIEDLKYTVALTPAGKRVKVTVIRNGELKRIRVKLGRLN
jgi:hypothetical protein